jgi:hypothetical protein
MPIASLSQQAPNLCGLGAYRKSLNQKRAGNFSRDIRELNFAVTSLNTDAQKLFSAICREKRPHSNTILVQGLNSTCLGPDNAARGGGSRPALPSFVAVMLFKINLVEPLAPANRGPYSILKSDITWRRGLSMPTKPLPNTLCRRRGRLTDGRRFSGARIDVCANLRPSPTFEYGS